MVLNIGLELEREIRYAGQCVVRMERDNSLRARLREDTSTVLSLQSRMLGRRNRMHMRVCDMEMRTELHVVGLGTGRRL